jgi:hypothetical protein
MEVSGQLHAPIDLHPERETQKYIGQVVDESEPVWTRQWKKFKRVVVTDFTKLSQLILL